MLGKEIEIAEQLARDAGKRILEHFHAGFVVEEKPLSAGYTEPVTIADRESSTIIVEGLAKAFPDDAVLSEEEPDETEKRLRSKRVWIIDPLDGTKGFSEKQDDFAVQIGLVENGIPVLGVVFQPIGDVLYSAVRGGGAFMTTPESSARRLQVSDKQQFDEMTLAVSRSHRSKRMGRILEHFAFEKEFPHGSVGLKVGFVARQSADLYIHLSPHTKFWDTASPQIIIEEAGGRLTDIYGEEIDYSLRDVRNLNGILTSNGVSHAKAVSHLRPLLTEFGRLRAKQSTHI